MSTASATWSPAHARTGLATHPSLSTAEPVLPHDTGHSVTPRDAESGDQQTAIDELLSIVSHELRSPLTAIKGCARTLLRHARTLDADTSQQLLRDIDQEAERLHRLVENLLELSRAGSDGAPLVTKPMAVETLIRRVVADITPHAGERRFRLRLEPRLPRVRIDAVRIELVIRNLLDNAVKYTPSSGTIDIAASRRGAKIVVIVADDGLGIAPEHRDRVFDRFFRVEPPGMNVGGAGLGLAICRRFVEMHGGRIELDSSREHGASFRLTLPLEGAAAVSHNEAAEPGT